MTVLYGAAICLAVVLLAAAGGKALDHSGTTTTMRDFGVPAPEVSARTLPVVEAAVAVALVVWPVLGAVASGVLLGVFTILLLDDLRRGRATPCRCFGSVSASAVSGRTIARNAALIGLAVASAFASRPW